MVEVMAKDSGYVEVGPRDDVKGHYFGLCCWL